nr:hypothetical protein [Candidatus Sigynarchaeota archaeon]
MAEPGDNERMEQELLRKIREFENLVKYGGIQARGEALALKAEIDDLKEKIKASKGDNGSPAPERDIKAAPGDIKRMERELLKKAREFQNLVKHGGIQAKNEVLALKAEIDDLKEKIKASKGNSDSPAPERD